MAVVVPTVILMGYLTNSQKKRGSDTIILPVKTQTGARFMAAYVIMTINMVIFH